MKEFVNKLIGRLEEYQGKIKLHFGNRGDFDFMEVDAVKEIVNELAEEYINTSTDTSTDTSSGWISVKDKLPTEEGSYLVVGKTGGATVTRWYMPNKFHPQGHFGGNSAEYIRYWMPRPQAPKYEPKENETLTNADRIRSMTDEELAEFLYDTNHYFENGEYLVRFGGEIVQDEEINILDWLKSEAEGVTENE